jgi:hypothetical protein
MRRRPRRSSRPRGARRSPSPATSATRTFATRRWPNRRQLGGLDILVNNAGEQHPDEDITRHHRGAAEAHLPDQHLLDVLPDPGGAPHLKKGAAIINCTSITMYKGSKELLDYSRPRARSPPSPARCRRIWSATASASTRSRPGRSGLRSTRSAASRRERSPNSARTRRWAGPASPTRSRRPSCSWRARIPAT